MPGNIRLAPPPPPRRSGNVLGQAMAGSVWGGGYDDAGANGANPGNGETQTAPSSSKLPATETIGRRAGSLSDELDFPEFVASLVQGTWDAMVDSAIRQMDSFADLVAAISKPVSQFRDENVTVNQARDWLVAQYPSDLALDRQDGGFGLAIRSSGDDGGFGPSPDWLSDYGLAGQTLTPELVEEQLIPAARDRLARDRMQTLATLVTLGMNRIVVRDGSITARLRFRAAAADKTSVDYAVSDDPGNATPAGSWSTRGSTAYQPAVTKVSTVGVNAQTDSSLNAELFGEVKINFVSETLPLERFADDARRVLIDRSARPAPPATAAAPAAAPAAPQLPPPTPSTSGRPT